jgi:ABC-type transport system substrate-binding protein
VWPLPPGLAGEPLPAAYRLSIEPAVPPRRLMLVMRADLPPTTRPAARAALAHGINRSELVKLLGPGAHEGGAWLAGAPPFEFPRLDAREVEGWLDRGDLPHSFHAVMAYDADGAGAAIARAMQGEWSRLGLYVDLMPLRGQALESELLRGSKAHLALVEWQPPLDAAAAQLAYLVMPLRGPAVGAVRTGWRTREFDTWLRPRRAPPALDPAAAQARLEQEIIALPVADLAWTWVERRELSGVHFHPHFGPEATARVTLEGSGR